MASADKLGQALGNVGKLQEDQERIKRLKRSQQQDELEGEEAANMVYTDSSTFLKVTNLLVTVSICHITYVLLFLACHTIKYFP